MTDHPSAPEPRGHEAVPAAMLGQHQRHRLGRRRDEYQMVPDATFTSYYGRPIVKESPWQEDIPAYLFLGGLAAGSSLLSAGADLTDRPVLRRAGRLTAMAALSASFAALVHDLGKPSRFINMLRVVKVTSPMSIGTWLLSGYAPFVYAAGAHELIELSGLGSSRPRGVARLLRFSARPAGLAAATIAPAVAAYTGVLLADTATPSWNSARRELPFLFASSAAAAAAGMGMLCAPVSEAGPARRLAVGAAVAEFAIEHQMEASMGIAAEPLHRGRAGQLMRAARAFTAVGGVTALGARRSRVVAAVSGATLLAGSICTRFGIFEAGQASARDPKYTVVPQRERMVAQNRPGA